MSRLRWGVVDIMRVPGEIGVLVDVEVGWFCVGFGREEDGAEGGVERF